MQSRFLCDDSDIILSPRELSSLHDALTLPCKHSGFKQTNNLQAGLNVVEQSLSCVYL